MEEVRQNLRGIFTHQIDTLSLSAPKPGKESQRKRLIAAILLASLLIGSLLVSSLLSRVKENSHVANSNFEAERIKEQEQKKRQLQAYVKKLTADVQRERRVVREHSHQTDFQRKFDDLLRYRYSPLVLALLQQKNYEGLVATLSDGLNDLKEFTVPNDDNKWEILFLAQRSDCYLKLKSYKSAAADVEAAQNFLSKRVNQSYEFYVRFARTKLLLAQNNLKAAFTEFNLAIPSFEKIGFEHQFGNSTLFDVPRTKDSVYKTILPLAENTSPSTKEEEEFKRRIVFSCVGSKESDRFSHLIKQ
jgi:tetratricopeptide (TPR) repeat protein